jgi:SAM-dependent methyltransferase
VELIGSDCATLAVPDASVDLLFCHQTFHHLVEQEKALAEFYRVLAGRLPAVRRVHRGLHRYLGDSLAVPHPMHVQKRRAVSGDAPPGF